MRAIIQRVSSASVEIENAAPAKIDLGLLVLIGIAHSDTEEDANWLCRKIATMRLFADENGKMNLSVNDVQGDLLLVSQFTLYASTRKGNRSSFTGAAQPDTAVPLYQTCIRILNRELGREIKTGQFGAEMQVSLVNSGPVTIILDSTLRE